MSTHWSHSPRKHELVTPKEFAAMTDDERAKAILSLRLQITFMAAKLDRYRLKVAQMEADDLRIHDERAARCAGPTA